MITKREKQFLKGLNMFRSKIKNRYRKGRNLRLYQGDILKELSFATIESRQDLPKKSVTLQKVSLRFAIVLSQDCDLEHDSKFRKENLVNQDKFLLSILICPAYELEKFANGEHLSGWEKDPNWKMNPTPDIKGIKDNNSYKRYHFLHENNKFLIPELIIDFKHFFTLPRNFIYSEKKTKYLASLSELFREELSQRFTSYLSRIGLPEI